MKRNNKIVLVLMILLGVFVFWYEGRKTNFHQIIQGLQHLKWAWLLVAVLLMVFSIFAESLVLKRLLYHEGDAKQPFWNILRVPAIEAVFNAITPFSSGGQPAQLVALLQIGYEGGRASSVLLLKFIIYQVVVLMNFVVTMLIGFHRVVSQFQGLAWLISFGFIIHVVTIGALLMIMFYYRFTKGLVLGIFKMMLRLFPNKERIISWQSKAIEKIDTFHQESLKLKKEKKKVLGATGLTILQLLAYYLIPYFVLLALNVQHINLLTVFSMHVMIVMITSIFPIPGGAGGAEYSFKTLFSVFVGGTPLILGMFLWRIITFYLGMVLGIVATSVGPIRNLPQQEKKSE